ncbi:TPA_asm: hypothetical protein GB227_22755 [Salmonella enterica subsp. enterica serovar Muenchen]|uniref:Uncharacterized protein n=1 Tax=Salmonella muenchen TaxID=596 RepID=A0A6Y4F5N8_SALMU|nr:hypothetical protein [Salmonella enterica subsp. enterica serovar Muenchen]
MNKETKVFKCNPHADISDYKDLVLSDKEIEALLQKGKTGEGKKTDMRTGLGVVLPSRILGIEQLTEITYDLHSEDTE